MPKKFTDTGNPNAVEIRRETSYDQRTGQRIETYVMSDDDVSSFLSGTLAPFTGGDAPFSDPVANLTESRENGVATITIYRDFGYDSSGNINDPTTDDLSVTFEILGVEKVDPLSQIPYLKTNRLDYFPNVSSAASADKLKNVRLRALHELLALPQSERPKPGDTYIPSFATQYQEFDPSWDEFLLKGGAIPGISGADDVNLNEDVTVTFEDNGTDKERDIYLFGRDSSLVTNETMNDSWNLPIPVSHLLGGDESNTPTTLQDSGPSVWPEWLIYQHAFENGIEGIYRYDYTLRKTTTRSNAFAAQHSLQNVGKIKLHANIFTELGVSSGALKMAFTSDFTGTGWLKQAPEIRTQANGSFQIVQDYLNISANELNTNFYETY